MIRRVAELLVGWLVAFGAVVVWLVAIGVVLFLLGEPMHGLVQAQDVTHGRIVVEARDFRSTNGRVRCFLFASADGYPTRVAAALASASARVGEGRTARCVFDDIPAGTYALALHHDEDADGRMDTGLFGIPTEGTGASNDARAAFGPPSFESARFTHASADSTLRVRMAYVF